MVSIDIVADIDRSVSGRDGSEVKGDVSKGAVGDAASSDSGLSHERDWSEVRIGRQTDWR